MDFVSWDDEIPNWMESHKIHVPNHQADLVGESSAAFVTKASKTHANELSKSSLIRPSCSFWQQTCGIWAVHYEEMDMRTKLGDMMRYVSYDLPLRVDI